MIKSRTYIAVPPGATIKEQLEYRGMSQKEFALRMDFSEKHISKLINGDVHLTPDVAVRLEMVLGIPAKYWNRLEADYREKIVKVNAENAMDEDLLIAKKISYVEMSKYGWLPETTNKVERVNYLRKYFEVVSLQVLENDQLNRIAYRRLKETEQSNFGLLAWLQKAKLEARKIETRKFNVKLLEKKLPEIKDLILLSPEEFLLRLTESLASCGVAFVFLPHLKGTYLHGATFLNGKKVVLGLTMRGKDADKFWFSLFHELGHIILGHINQEEISDVDEAAVDQFAQECLISNEVYTEFVEKNDFSKKAIQEFARDNHILCGIVVGRLQKDKYISHSQCNELKEQYNFFEVKQRI